MWAPGHRDILGNVDILAKQAVKRENALQMSILHFQRQRDRVQCIILGAFLPLIDR